MCISIVRAGRLHMFPLTPVKLIQTATCGSNKEINCLSLFPQTCWISQRIYNPMVCFWQWEFAVSMLLSTFHCTGDRECVGARTKLNMRGCPHCPLCFLQYFYLADFNVIISPVVSVRWKTHPPSNNTPLSIRGTETHAHTEFTVRTLKSVIWTWIKHKVLL